jgi:predicted RNA-binding Zn ribbon-like protein
MAEETLFIFVGEAFVLDLVNTVKMVRGQLTDLLQTEADLAAWWALAQTYHQEIETVEGAPIVFDENTLATVKQVRGHLHDLFLNIIHGEQPSEGDLAALNWALGTGRPALAWNGSGQVKYVSTGEPTAELLLPAGLSALRLLTQADLSRLHKCQNNQCVMLFYDTTKSGTRHWCSTACMDRERSRRRYREAKSVQN